MQINDIISEKNPMDEAPAGLIGQGLKRVGAKVAGAVGMKGAAASLTGKADTGKEANQLMVDLKGYLGRTGGNLKQLDASNLANFLKQKGYPTTSLQGASGALTPKQVDQALLKAVQAKAQSGDAAQGGGQPAAGSAQPAGDGAAQGGGAEQPAQGGFKAGFAAARRKAPGAKAAPAAGSTQPAGDGATQPAAGAAQKPGATQPAAGAAAPNVPPELAKKITQLTPQQKQELAGMLQ
jgi:hypothetical protein